MKTKDYSNEIDMRRLIRELKQRKWLFAGLFVLIFGLTVAYVARRESDFTAHSAILIEENSDSQGGRAGSMMQMMRIFSIGGFASSSVDNEMLLINTIDVAARTVKALNLNVTCIEKKGIINKTLFEDIPVILTPSEETSDTLSKSFNVKVTVRDGKADIKVYTGRFFKSSIYKNDNVSLPCNISTKYGDFTLAANPGKFRDGTFVFGVSSYSEAAWTLYKNVRTEILDKLADGVEFTYTCKNRNLAAAVLNTMMAEYNLKRLERKREISLTELNFITDRINSLYTDLKESEAKVEKFKTESNFVDIEAEAPIILESSLNAHEELLKASAQILYYEQILKLLKSNSEGMLPTISTPGEDGKSSQSGIVAEYNEQMALLMELRRSAKPGNQALAAAEARVEQMRNTILTSYSQLLGAAKTAVAQRSGIVGTMDSHLKKLPAFEREYINLSRDQLLKNELYAFLVEKRENALMKLNSEDTLGYVIDKAYVEPKPSKKKAALIICLGLALAIATPICVALFLMARKNKVANAFDLAAFDLENSTLEVANAGDSGATIRAAIISRLKKGVLYIAGCPASPSLEALISSSLSKSGVSYVIESPECVDTILGDKFRTRIEEAESDNTYIIIPIPGLENIRSLTPAINNDDTLCVLAIKPDSYTRKEFAGLVTGIKPENLLLVLI